MAQAGRPVDDAVLLAGFTDHTLIALYEYAQQTGDEAAADAIALEVGIRAMCGRWAPGLPICSGCGQGIHRPPCPGEGGANDGGTEHERSDLTDR